MVRKGVGGDGRQEICHHQEHPNSLLFSSHREIQVLHQTFNTHSLFNPDLELVSCLCCKIEN